MIPRCPELVSVGMSWLEDAIISWVGNDGIYTIIEPFKQKENIPNPEKLTEKSIIS